MQAQIAGLSHRVAHADHVQEKLLLVMYGRLFAVLKDFMLGVLRDHRLFPAPAIESRKPRTFLDLLSSSDLTPKRSNIGPKPQLQPPVKQRWLSGGQGPRPLTGARCLGRLLVNLRVQ